MAKIHISDLHHVSSEPLLTDLTISEQNGVNGGGLWALLKAVAAFVVDVLVWGFTHKDGIAMKFTNLLSRD